MNTYRKQPFFSSVLRIPDFGLRLAAALPLLLAWNLPVSAQPTNSHGRPDFSAFKLITDRNIFDPRRSPRNPSRPSRAETRRSFRAEYVTLVGIMRYDGQGPIAFFDGTSSQYQKVLKPADTIAGYKIAEIEPSYVKLAVGTNAFQLPVGMQLRRDSEGSWQLAEPTDSLPERADRPSFSRTGPQPPGPPTGPPAAATNGEPQAVSVDAESLLALIDGQSEAPATNAAPDAASGGGETDPVLLRSCRRNASQRSSPCAHGWHAATRHTQSDQPDHPQTTVAPHRRSNQSSQPECP